MKSDIYNHITTGGSGTLFWLRNHDKKLRQLPYVLENKTLIHIIINRFLTTIPGDNKYIVSMQSQKKEILRHNFRSKELRPA
jgi:mannose-1-phosphate guanylyltransferase